MTVTYSPLYGSDAEDELSPTYELDGDTIILHSTIYGGGGGDVIIGEAEPLQTSRYAFYGEAGDDTLKFADSSVRAYFSGGAGDDSLYLFGKRQIADGGDGYDTLYATDTTISADSVLNVEALLLNGKIRFDGVDLGDFDEVVMKSTAITLAAQTDLSDFNIKTTHATKLSITGSVYADRFDVSSYLGTTTIHSGGGDDIITAGERGLVADGGTGSDILLGGAGKDTLDGGQFEAGQTDTIYGYGGDDSISVSSGHAVIDGGEGSDLLSVTSNSKTPKPYHLSVLDFTGIEALGFFFMKRQVYLGDADTSSITKIWGPADIVMTERSVLQGIDIDGDITLTGSVGDDDVSIGKMNQSYFHFDGQGGNDTVSVETGYATLLGGAGDDHLSGGARSVSISGGAGDDVVQGSAMRDHLAGGAGNDTVAGGDGADVITLDATAVGNRDVARGDGDNDTFVFSGEAKGGGRISGGDGKDVIEASGDISGYAVDGVETLEVYGALTATAATLDSFDAILLYGRAPTQLILSSGGTFTWKSKDDRAGALTGSDETDMIDFLKAKASWTFDLGKGDDVSTLGQGHNEYFYGQGDGHDVVNHFGFWKGDEIHLERSDRIQSFDDLDGRIITHGDNVLIVLDDKVASDINEMHDVIELTNIKIRALDDDNIRFF